MQPQLLRPRHVPVRSLEQLLAWLQDQKLPVQLLQPADNPQLELTGITLASDRVAAGDLYVALTGARAHGADFSSAAIEAGAVAVLTDAAGGQKLAGDCPVPVVVTDDPRAILGWLSGWMYADPARGLQMVGVTGTNGKTTTSYMIDSCLRQAGVASGLIGTVETRLTTPDGQVVLPSARTTPEAPDLHAMLAVMRERGARAVVMEVSSHALCLGRVDGITFDVAVFTNLSQDHLDYHRSMEDYFAAKASLFTTHRARQAVVCLDDEWGQRLAELTELPCQTYSGAENPAAQWRVTSAQFNASDTQMVLSGPDTTGQRVERELQVGLPGRFNVANAVAAAAVCQQLRLPVPAIASGLAQAQVPGRMQQVQWEGQAGAADFAVLVDYAHTPAAVETALAAIRPTCTGKIWCVLGCGGDRDQAKRPIMGQAAANGADVVVITDDNPRSEDPALIRAAVVQAALAVGGSARVEEVADRAQAIEFAISNAQTGDVVAILGKGHERGQETSSGVQPFDDRQVAMDALQRKFSPEAATGESGLPAADSQGQP